MKKFGKIVSFVCIVSIFLSFSGCQNSSNGNDNDKVFGKETVYNSVVDYSGEQGYKNWYYLTARDTLEETEYMVYDSEMCTWRTKDINCLIEPHIWHPGQLDQVIKAWKAPEDGRIVIKSELQRRPVNKNGSGQDGCYVYIALNDDDILCELIVDALDLDYHNLNTAIEVEKGQFVYFVLNCNGNYTYDQTYWEMIIEYSDEQIENNK